MNEIGMTTMLIAGGIGALGLLAIGVGNLIRRFVR